MSTAALMDPLYDSFQSFNCFLGLPFVTPTHHVYTVYLCTNARACLRYLRTPRKSLEMVLGRSASDTNKWDLRLAPLSPQSPDPAVERRGGTPSNATQRSAPIQ